MRRKDRKFNLDILPTAVSSSDISTLDLEPSVVPVQLAEEDTEDISQDTGGFDPLEDLIGSKLDDHIDNLGDEDEDLDDDTEDTDYEDTAFENDIFDFELDGEMLTDIWEDVRRWVHSVGFDYTFDAPTIQNTRKRLEELIMRSGRSGQDEKEMKYLIKIVNGFDASREEYLGAVPYKAKAKERVIKYVKHQLKKMSKKSKMPEWFLPIAVFVIPDLVLLSKLFSLKASAPKYSV